MKYFSNKETNGFIRSALKEAFPGVKFSVSHSGAGSTDVNWTDGPSAKAVDAIVRPFSGSSFDGMIDLESPVYAERDGERVHYGAKYIFTHRDLSEAAKEEAKAVIRSWGADPDTMDSFNTPVEFYALSQEVGSHTSIYSMVTGGQLVRDTASLMSQR